MPRIAKSNYIQLNRSPVDITDDGQILRLCTLILNPRSLFKIDTKFGFDLRYFSGDFIIEAIDEGSPAKLSGLSNGDRIVQVEGVDVKGLALDKVFNMIEKAEYKSKLKLLVTPNNVINYGNPSVLNNHKIIHQAVNRSIYKPNPEVKYFQTDVAKPKPTVAFTTTNESRSMPDLVYEKDNEKTKSMVYKSFPYDDHQMHSTSKNLRNYYVDDDNYLYKQPTTTSSHFTNNNLNRHLSKSYSELYNPINTTNTNLNTEANKKTYVTSYQSPRFLTNNQEIVKSAQVLKSSFVNYDNDLRYSFIRPVPRLCTITKSDQYALGATNIGFGINVTQDSFHLPRYMRVNIVNFKSPAYLAGLEAGDLIVEINRRSTLNMSENEALYYIKTLYEMNKEVKLLVVSEFCYNWLKENNLLNTLNSDDSTVFGYDEYLKSNYLYVPRLCKMKLFPFSKSFGITVETLITRYSNNYNTTQNYAHIVIKVEKDSPAYASNIRKGDRIIECDGLNVEDENEREIAQRLYEALLGAKQVNLLVVDGDTDNYFKSKCVKLHSMLPIVKTITSNFK